MRRIQRFDQSSLNVAINSNETTESSPSAKLKPQTRHFSKAPKLCSPYTHEALRHFGPLILAISVLSFWPFRGFHLGADTQSEILR